MSLDPFYPIFDRSEWLSRLLPLGIRLTQLRIKNLPEQRLRREIQTAKRLTAAFNCQLVINDYWQLAMELGCDYVHLGQQDLDDADLAGLKNARIKIGISTHSEAELERALALQPDYIALGPVYPTILKKMVWEPQGLKRITQWKKRIGDIPLIGIGGLNLERAAVVLEAGADVVSMVTDITLDPHPEARVMRWLERTSIYRRHRQDKNL